MEELFAALRLARQTLDAAPGAPYHVPQRVLPTQPVPFEMLRVAVVENERFLTEHITALNQQRGPLEVAPGKPASDSSGVGVGVEISLQHPCGFQSPDSIKAFVPICFRQRPQSLQKDRT